MEYRSLPQYLPNPSYQVNQCWDGMEDWISRMANRGLDLNPDFQRGHVWTETQQIKYIEHILQGGGYTGSNILKFNNPGWMQHYSGPFVIVDGLQRLTAAMKFLNSDLKIFNKYHIDDFKDRMPSYVEFVIQINNLKTRKEVLRWYLELNSEGTPHDKAEIERIRLLYEYETC